MPHADRPVGMRSDRLRLPAGEVEDATRRRRFGVAPWISPAIRARRAVRGTVILSLARQPPPAPARVGAGFGMAHIHRPRRRQRNPLEHAEPRPLAVALLPERRMLQLRLDHPRPVRVGPPLLPGVAAGLDEPEKVFVRDVARDRSRRPRRRARADRTRCPSQTGSRRAPRPVAPGRRGRRCPAGGTRGPVLTTRYPAGACFCSSGSRCHM